jgi:excinuclease ABC subunit A
MKSHYQRIKTNNLKNIDITISHNDIILINGVSGSGKSSLAIDTIHAISTNELNQLMNIKNFLFKYSVNHYSNILPSISLSQENFNRNPRSTIATYFGLDTYFKTIFSSLNKVSASIFQFNRYKYACKKCFGTGHVLQLDPSKIIDYNFAIKDIPFLNWRGTYSDYYKQLIKLFCNDKNIDLSQNLLSLDKQKIDLMLYGKSSKKYKINYRLGGRKRVKTSTYIGPLNNETIFSLANEKQFKTEEICSNCKGYRFSKNTLKYTVFGKNLGELYTTEIESVKKWIITNKKHWQHSQDVVTAFEFILNLINKFIDLNLNYISLNRSIPSLSGGELQRLRLSKSLNSQFNNFMYILDEPSSGLHPKEIEEIAQNISNLKKKDNTVLIIEHNDIFKKISDKTLTLGPRGGKEGGYLITSNEIENNEKKLNYKFFSSTKNCEIKSASYNNIINISAIIPLNSFVSICGVSGSGKTSFLKGIIPQYLKNPIYLNQSPIKGNNYSIVASYLGIFDEIRNKFAIYSGLTPSHFSFHHSAEGKCNTCKGTGIIKEENSYSLANSALCPECDGSRFSHNILKYDYMGFNIYKFLNLTISEILHLIKGEEKLSKTINSLKLLSSIGLDYLTLFRKISTLSGGEAQRIKLCKVLSAKRKCTYLLDEPLRGVDPVNAYKIINLIYKITKQDNTVFVAEHNLIALQYSSYIIEFGPGAGRKGGQILYLGKRKEISSSTKSIIKDYI